MSLLVVCNHKDDIPICKKCKHAEKHIPMVTNSFGQTCDAHRAVCVDRHKECLCISVDK